MTDLAPAPSTTSIELFTGAGGLAQALDQVSQVGHLLAVEIDRRACETLLLNKAFSHNEPSRRLDPIIGKWPLFAGDIRKVDFASYEGKVDIVAGGVPCQPWSLGGVHRGFHDDRNLWPELFRTIRETRPKVVIAENVKGLLRKSFKEYYDYILDSLAAPFEEALPAEDWQDHHKRLRKVRDQEIGPAENRYNVTYKLVNAADYGVPQQRWRVFVVAFRADLGLENWKFPDGTHSEAALFNAQMDGTYWDRHGIEPLPPLVKSGAVVRGSLPWLTLRDAISDLPEPLGHRVEHPKWFHHVGWSGARTYVGHTPNILDKPAKTVKAGVHGVPGGESVIQLDDRSIRYMTVRETARLMTFPDDWRFAGPRGEQMRQLGNAVPVELGRVITESVIRALRSVDCEAQMNHPHWRDDHPSEEEWRPPKNRPIAAARAEQDDAAGSREVRTVTFRDQTTALASVELKKNPKGRRIYANLRFARNRKTVTVYIAEVNKGSRIANLREAWRLAIDGGLLNDSLRD